MVENPEIGTLFTNDEGNWIGAVVGYSKCSTRYVDCGECKGKINFFPDNSSFDKWLSTDEPGYCLRGTRAGKVILVRRVEAQLKED